MTTLTDRLDATHHYAAHLRNAAKRAYAFAYRAMLIEHRGGFMVTEPPRNGLSVMGAQAVRLRLHAIWNGEEA